MQTPEINLDTGKPTERGAYPLADATYRQLLDSLASDNFNHMNEGLKNDILRFYDGFGFPKPGTRLDNCIVQRWRKTWIELNQVRVMEVLDSFDQPVPATASTTATLRYSVSIDTCMQ